MAVIIRIDVDRPYGKGPLVRHLLSRCGSDLYFPRVPAFGYLRELDQMLRMLGEHDARAYVFFRRCSLPNERLREVLDRGRHEIGLHLENSRSFETFQAERRNLENYIGQSVSSFSKHGSGGEKYGLRHYAPYEPDRYVEWAQKDDMRVFFGNLEDPTIEPRSTGRFSWFPSAFWLEPGWRDQQKFSVDWLLRRGKETDIVLLVHPENVFEDSELTADFRKIVSTLESKILS